MTSEEWDEVRAAMALPGWRWMPGMHGGGKGYSGLYDAVVVVDVDYGDPCLPDRWVYKGHLYGAESNDWADDWADVVPNVRDPATAGCLLALLGEPTVEGAYSVSVRDPDGAFSSGHAQWLGLAIIRCALDRGRWGDA